jgi:hypothetical protein
MAAIAPLQALCINLDKQPQKWNDTVKEFANTGIQLERFSAILHEKGWIGCGESHLAVIRIAMERGLPWVLVVEDDCMLSEDFNERWPAIRKALWDSRDSWDIFLGGPSHIQGPASLRPNGLIEIENAYSTHFFVMNASAYARTLAWSPEKHGPIDVYYSDSFQIVTAKPLIAIQRPSYSDILEEEVNRNILFGESEEKLMKLLYVDRTRVASVVLLGLSAAVGFWLFTGWGKRGRGGGGAGGR